MYLFCFLNLFMDVNSINMNKYKVYGYIISIKLDQEIDTQMKISKKIVLGSFLFLFFHFCLCLQPGTQISFSFC